MLRPWVLVAAALATAITMAIVMWYVSERSYAQALVRHSSNAPTVIQRIPEYWGRREVPCDSLEIVKEEWIADMTWPVRMLLGPNQLLVIEGAIFGPGDTLEFAYDSHYGKMTVNNILPLDPHSLDRLRELAVRENDLEARERNARAQVCFYKDQIEGGFGIIELKNWFSSSSRSATESEVTEALQLLALARMETLSDEQSARCRELGLYEMYISEVVKRARFQTR